MAASLVPKRQNFVTRLTAANLQFLQANDALLALKAEWDANAYAAGATPTSNNVVDADLTGTLSYLTAAQVNQAIAAQVTVCNATASNRGSLEALRG